ncbi:MAG TPA: aminopeptidase P family N-terminal domain-containing protein, partial [Pyrinomonadaceae bacterium]|nr:aminopeptidase P family N-terminal domain-containing protein [Pyrinomonadaceae bacterium]
MNAQQEFDDRIAKVRQAMRGQGLQTLLVFDAGRHNFLRMNYVAYLTDFIGVGPETGLVLPLEDAPVLYLAPVWDIPRAKEESSSSDVRPFNELWNRLAKLSGKTGLVGREAMHVDLYDELVKTLKQTPVNAKDIVENMARCKGAFDLERLRKAAEIADA